MTNPFPLPQKIRDALEQMLDCPLLPTQDEHLANNPEDRLDHISASLDALWRWLESEEDTSVELDTLAIQAQPPMTNPPAIPNEIRQALEQVLAYAMPDEAEDYGNRPPEERDGHIYQSLIVLSRWLNTGKIVIQAELDALAIQARLEADDFLALE
jgi:hypothetical protein